MIVALAILTGIWLTLWLIKSAIWPPGGPSTTALEPHPTVAMLKGMDFSDIEDPGLLEFLEENGTDDDSVPSPLGGLIKHKRAKEREGRIFEPRGRADQKPTPLDLDELQRTELLELLRDQVPEDDACYCVGLDPATFRRWMRQSASDDECRQFRMDVMQAQGRGVAIQTRKVFRADDRLGTARFLIERKRPAAFGPRPAIGVSVSATIGGGSGRPLDATEEQQAGLMVDVLTAAGVALPDDIRATLEGRVPDALEYDEGRVLEAVEASSGDSSPAEG